MFLACNVVDAVALTEGIFLVLDPELYLTGEDQYGFIGIVGDLMSKELVVIDEDASIRDVLELAKSHGIRRIPLVGRSGELTGIVSLDDLIAELASELGHLVDAVRSEMRAHPRRSLERQ